MALDDRLLEMKKNVIRQTVKKICTEDGVKEPLINFEGCPEENKWGQLAHYHPDKHMICISKRQLQIQDFSELKRTAIHEMTHAIGFYAHNTDFTHVATEIGKSTAGLTPEWASNKETVSSQDQKSEKSDTITKNMCSVNGCLNRIDAQCGYCYKFYCQKHLEATITTTLNEVNSIKPEDAEKRVKYTQDWQKQKGHSCFEYTGIWNKWYETKKKLEQEAFDAFLDGEDTYRYIPPEPALVLTVEKNTKKPTNFNGNQITFTYKTMTDEEKKIARKKLSIDMYDKPHIISEPKRVIGKKTPNKQKVIESREPISDWEREKTEHKQSQNKTKKNSSM